MSSHVPHRAALAGLSLSVVLAVGAFAAAFTGAAESAIPAVVLGVATAGMMASLMLLAGGRRGGGATAAAAAVVVVVAGGGLATAFLVGAPSGPDAPLLGGLPTGVALLVYGAGLLPALVVPLLYAWTFDRTTMPPEVLERVRAAAAEVGRAAGRDAPGPRDAPDPGDAR